MSDLPAVREPRPDDLDAVTAMWVDLATDQCRHGSHLVADDNASAAREGLAGRVVADGLRVAGGDDPVGFVTFELERGQYKQDRSRGLVHDLYVVPEWRDKGVGSRLLSAAETALADRGAEVVAVQALAPNAAARRMYERHGYTVHRVEMERPVADRNDTNTSDD